MGTKGAKILGVCVAAPLIVLSLAACSPSASETNQEELGKRGFTEVVEQSYVDRNALAGGDTAVYFADASGCRVVLQWEEQPLFAGEEWVLVEKSSKGSTYDVKLPNPTAVKVGVLDAFQHCYTEDSASDTE